MKITLIKTCIACPEQYEAYDEQWSQVGFLRLRNGRFRVEFPDYGGEVIYEAQPEGDGIFDPDERAYYLAMATQAIERKLIGRRDL
jgi:hypothetical protein